MSGWRYRGFAGVGPEPALLGKYRGGLIVLGGARCVWDDYLALVESGFSGQVMCVNDIGMYFVKPFHHWVSMHHENLMHWYKLAQLHHVNMIDIKLHTQRRDKPPLIGWTFGAPEGYSGLFAADVGVCLGYDKVVLCGVPMDDSGRFFDPPWTGNHHGGDRSAKRATLNNWSRNGDVKTRVRSMSGWTREILGGIDSWQ